MNKIFLNVLILLVPVMMCAAQVAEYSMDESLWNGTLGEVEDSIGSNNGTARNGATIVTGVEGNGGSFDGVDDYIQLNNELSKLRGTASLSVWIKTTQTGDDTMWRAPGITGIEENGGGDDIFWGWIDASGHIGITVANDPAAKSTSLINDGRWHHVVLTRDEPNQEVIVYVDGVEEARNSNATSGTIGNTFSSLGRIEDTDGTHVYYEGEMDEVQIFDLVLTEEDVKDLYNEIPDFSSIPKPTVEYRMDECYWLGSAYTDVLDSSVNGLNGSSYNNAIIDNNNAQINFSGKLDGTADYVDIANDPIFTLTDTFSVSFWIYPEQDTADEYYINKRANRAGWYVWFDNRVTDRIEFSLRINNGWRDVRINKPANWTNNWHFISATYDGNQMRLLIDDLSQSVAQTGQITNSDNNPVLIGQYSDANYFEGNIDEVKIWNVALTNGEVNAIYTHEGSGSLNYDGTVREPVTCEATSEANSWTMVGIPIDLRTDPKTVTETFQGMTGTYGTDWRVYRRDYSDANNSSWYTYLDDPDTNMTEFGKGYLLGNALDTNETWNVDGTQAVDYDSAQADCPANQCVEIDVKSVSLDVDAPDDLLGTGPYRYNMTGFTGKSPVSWADCRFIIDGTVYTPTEAENNGYASKVIWQYNPGPGADSNGYTSCDDTTPGTCLLEPYKGFWVELHGPTKNLPVKLLIPQE